MTQERTNAQMGYGKCIDDYMNTKNCDKKTCRYLEGLQEGEHTAEKTMKKRASHFIKNAIQQINKKHGLELNVDNYVNNLIFAMEWSVEGKTMTTLGESDSGFMTYE